MVDSIVRPHTSLLVASLPRVRGVGAARIRSRVRNFRRGGWAFLAMVGDRGRSRGVAEATAGRTPARRRPRRGCLAHALHSRPSLRSRSDTRRGPGSQLAPPDRSRPVRAGDQRLPQSHPAHHHRTRIISVTPMVAVTQCEVWQPSGQYVKRRTREAHDRGRPPPPSGPAAHRHRPRRHQGGGQGAIVARSSSSSSAAWRTDGVVLAASAKRIGQSYSTAAARVFAWSIDTS